MCVGMHVFIHECVYVCIFHRHACYLRTHDHTHISMYTLMCHVVCTYMLVDTCGTPIVCLHSSVKVYTSRFHPYECTCLCYVMFVCTYMWYTNRVPAFQCQDSYSEISSLALRMSIWNLPHIVSTDTHTHTHMQMGSNIVVTGGVPAGNEVFLLFTAPEIAWTDTTSALKPPMSGCESQGAAAVGLTLFVFGGKLADGSLRNSSYRCEVVRVYIHTHTHTYTRYFGVNS